MDVLPMVSVVGVAILAVLSAIVSVHVSQQGANVYETDRDKFLPKFFKVENFYRSLAINLSMGGMSLGLVSSFSTNVASLGKFILHPVLLVLLNLLAGLVAAIAIRDESEIPQTRKARARVGLFFLMVMIAFGLSAWPLVQPLIFPPKAKTAAKDETHSVLVKPQRFENTRMMVADPA